MVESRRFIAIPRLRLNEHYGARLDVVERSSWSVRVRVPHGDGHKIVSMLRSQVTLLADVPMNHDYF